MENYDFEKIGQELKRLRTERAYTQEQVADDLGCTISFVSNVENNRTKLNLRVLVYYSRLCNVTIDSILKAGQTDTELQNISENRDCELLNIIHQFTPDQQDMILKTLKYIKGLS